MTFAMLSLAAALTAGAAELKPEIRNVRICSPKIAVSRAHADSSAFVTGQFRVDMSFARNTAKMPVVRLVCLCEAAGAMSVQTVFLNRLRTYDPMRDSERSAALKAAGVTVSGKERDAYLGDPSKFTPLLPEVTKAAFAGAVYGTGDVDRGFFRLGRSATIPKILLYRIEVWQNGVLVARHDSSRTGLGSYEIPPDWYLPKKYPQKFVYVDVR